MKICLLAGLLLEALILGGLALHVPGADSVGSVHLTNLFIALMAVSGAVYFAAVAWVLRRPPPPRVLAWILAIAVAMRLTVLFAPPFLSSDVYRYVWDGKVQAAGISPYRTIPADPALASLRDDAIYPHVNRRNYAPTIYPPMAQLIFAAVARVSATVTAMKAAMVGFELLAMAAIVRLLDLARLPRARVLIYAWNPLAVWCFAGNGHADALVVGFIALALLARGRRRDSFAGAALAGAILIKFLPAVVAPALWRRGDWRLPVACIAVIGALYLCYIGVGWRVFGFLSAYAGEEGIQQGGGIWLLAGLDKLFPLPPAATWIYFGIVAVAFVWLGWTMTARLPLDRAAEVVRSCGNTAILAAAAMCAISAHYPWYFVWLAVPSCIAPYRSVIFLSAAAMLLYLDPLGERFYWPALLYVPAIVLAILDLRRTAPYALTVTNAVGRSA